MVEDFVKDVNSLLEFTGEELGTMQKYEVVDGKNNNTVYKYPSGLAISVRPFETVMKQKTFLNEWLRYYVSEGWATGEQLKYVDVVYAEVKTPDAYSLSKATYAGHINLSVMAIYKKETIKCNGKLIAVGRWK